MITIMQSLRLSRTRGMARLFFGIKFLGSRVREYKACLRLLKIWHGHGLQKTWITSGKSNQVKRLMSILYIPGLSESQQSGPCPPCCSEPRQWHARAFCPPWESTSWVIWEPMLVVKAVHSLINLTLHIITCNFVSHFPLGGRHCCAISLLSWWWSIYI